MMMSYINPIQVFIQYVPAQDVFPATSWDHPAAAGDQPFLKWRLSTTEHELTALDLSDKVVYK